MSLKCPLKWEGNNLGIISNGIEYFDIVHSEGDVYISILYICDENALAFCANTNLLSVLLLDSQCFNVSTVLLLHDFIFCLYDERHPFFVTV